MGTVVSFYGNQDPREIPLYAVPNVSHHLRIPLSTLRGWINSGLIKRDSDGMLGFNALTEAYVLATIRREFKLSLPKIRDAVAYVKDRFDHNRPLLSAALSFDDKSKSLMIHESDALVNITKRNRGQAIIQSVFSDSLARIDRDADGMPILLHPYMNTPREPKTISIDPRRSFGRPTISGTAILVQVVAERFFAGDKISQLADDYRLDYGVIEEALRWDGERRAAA